MTQFTLSFHIYVCIWFILCFANNNLTELKPFDYLLCRVDLFCFNVLVVLVIIEDFYINDMLTQHQIQEPILNLGIFEEMITQHR